MSMPRIDLRLLHSVLPQDEYAIVRRITVPKTWKLRASRPNKTSSDEARHADYVWRMVASYVSTKTQHHCMPVAATFYLPRGTDKAKVQQLDALVSKITATVPYNLWYGVSVWAGLYGEPGFDAVLHKKLTDDRLKRHATLRGEK